MKNFFNKTLITTARFSSFLIIGVSMVLYTMFSILRVDGSLASFIVDPSNVLWLVLNVSITIVLHQIVISTAVDNATSFGLETEEFKLADKLNGELIKKVGSEFESFVEFVKNLNEYERRTLFLSYIQGLGKKEKSDLSVVELKELSKLKPAIHDIQNFLRPCYVQLTKNGKISYDASYIENKRKLMTRINKVVSSLLFATITLGPALFSYGDFGSAMLNATITIIALLLTFITIFVPVYCRLKFKIPKIVYNKGVLVEMFEESKRSAHNDLETLQGTVDIPQIEISEEKTHESELNSLTEEKAI